MSQLRQDYLDIAKGIGILLVYIGHCEVGTTNIDFIIKWIYSFHMPLFFFISGFLFSNSSTTCKIVLKRKCFSLIIPYFIFSIYNWILLSVFITSPGNILFQGWGRNPLWFLPILFLINCVHSVFLYSKSREKLLVLLFLIALFIWKIKTNDWLPYSLSELPWFYLCFVTGYFFKIRFDTLFVLYKKFSGVTLLLIHSVLLFFFVLPYYPSYLHSDNNLFCWLIKYCLGLTGTFAVLFCCIYVSNRNFFINPIFIWFGRNSLVIMCSHKLYYEIFQTINYLPFLRGSYNHFFIWMLIIITVYLYNKMRVFQSFIDNNQ